MICLPLPLPCLPTQTSRRKQMSRKNILSNCVFVMDNAGMHNSLTLWNFYAENEPIVHFLSLYSYMLNPIEFRFLKIGPYVRRGLSDGFGGSFTNLVRESANELTESDFRGYCRHILKSCVKSVELESFDQIYSSFLYAYGDLFAAFTLYRCIVYLLDLMFILFIVKYS